MASTSPDEEQKQLLVQIVTKFLGGFTEDPDRWYQTSEIMFFQHSRVGVMIGHPYQANKGLEDVTPTGAPLYSHSWKIFNPFTSIEDAYFLVSRLKENRWRFRIHEDEASTYIEGFKTSFFVQAGAITFQEAICKFVLGTLSVEVGD